MNANYWQSQAYNMRLVEVYRNQIMQMAMSRFRWLNLPKTCNARYLEYTLMMEGCACICYPKSQVGTFYSTRVVTDTKPNVYDDYTKWRSVGNNGWSFYASLDSGVVVWDNATRFPIMMGIEIFARQLAHIQLTKEMNRFHQQVPWILKGPANRKNDMLQIAKQVSGGELAILAFDGFDDIDVEALQTQVPFIGGELAQDEKNTWNSVYQLLGIQNSTLKLERQTEDEIHAQQSPSTLVRMASLQERRRAADYLNERFGEYLEKPIQVVWREDNLSDNWNLMHNDRQLMESVGEM
jgi:hypothetical protein